MAKNESIKEGYIDIESKFMNEDFLKYIDRSKIKVIVSYHNTVETPKIEEIHKIYSKAVIQGADVVKIVTMAKNYDDCKRMLDLVRDADKLTIGMCMGKCGEITRYNKQNYMTFCTLNKKECSAPGQPTLDYMIKHFNRVEKLHNKHSE